MASSTVQLMVKGMYCNNCSNKVQQVLSDVEGVSNVKVDLHRGLADIKIARNEHGLETQEHILIETVLAAGFHVGLANKANALHTQASKPGARYTMLLSDINDETALKCALEKTEGVIEAIVLLSTSSAVIRFDPKLTNSRKLDTVASTMGSIVTSGSTVASPEIETCTLTLEGMTCSTCTTAIDKALRCLPFVVSVHVNLASETAIVDFDTRSGRSAKDLCEVVESIGFGAKEIVKNAQTSAADVVKAMHAHQLQNRQLWRRRLLFSLVFAVPMFVMTMILPRIPRAMSTLRLDSIALGSTTWMALLLWLLCTPVQFGVGSIFYRDTYYALKNGSPDMSVLIALGTSAAYFYSVLAVLVGFGEMTEGSEHKMGGEHFFETSSTLITFVLLGKYLEHRARGKMSEALLSLRNLQPPMAVLLSTDENGHVVEEKQVDVSQLRPGHLVKVLPGEAVPCDGVVEMGDSSADESMLTGESMPVLKQVGDTMIGSSINQEGALHVRATATGVDTALNKIIQLVENAQTTKPPIQNLADWVSGYFVKGVLLISAVSLVVWITLAYTDTLPSSYYGNSSRFVFALLFAISVLVIACPCALGLATPTAVMVSTGTGARLGVVFKTGKSLQSASNVDVVLFDKTNTLTLGKPTLVDVHQIKYDDRSIDENHLLWMVGSAESSSEHVLARALVNAAQERQTEKLVSPSPDTFRYRSGYGLECIVQEMHIAIGNSRWMAEKNIVVDDEASRKLNAMEKKGCTVLCTAVNNRLEALLSLSDIPRPESAPAVQALKHRGVEVWMVTGDNSLAAERMATMLGIEHVIAEALPAAKHQKVIELQKAGRCVAVVGDGINDSPALAQANVGIAIGAGTDVAMEAADVVLIRSHLSGVVTALELGRVTLRRIQLNLIWALGFNSIGIPVAAGLFFPLFRQRLPPELAALAMACSSVAVVTSSLLLRRFRAPQLASFAGDQVVVAIPDEDIPSNIELQIIPASQSHCLCPSCCCSERQCACESECHCPAPLGDAAESP